MIRHLLLVAVLAAGCHTSKVHDTSSTHTDTGDSLETDTTPPPSKCPVPEWASVSVNYFASCGIHTDGCIQCWGEESLPDLVEGECEEEGWCDWGGTNPPDELFVQVDMATEADWTQTIDYESSLFACGVTTSGHILCWGQGSDSWMIPPDDDDFVQVTAFSGGACGLHDDGRVTCWGYGCGTGYQDKRYSYIQASGSINCGIELDGTWSCWKLPVLGYGPAEGMASENPPSGVFKVLDASGSASCAIDTTGGVYCIGFWTGPGVDIGDGWGTTLPALELSDPVQAVSVSANDAFALLEDGTLLYGSDGDATLYEVDACYSWSAAAVSLPHRCAITTNGAMTCWGANGNGECDVPK